MTAESMSEAEFLTYAREVLFGDSLECLCESIAEHNSEVAMFGDAGPGSGYRLHRSIAEYNAIARQYTRITNCFVPRLPGLRSPD
jgi:hypothetical protein